MKVSAILGVVAAAMTLSGCAGMTTDQRFAVGGLAGSAAGLAIADATKADRTGKIVGTLAGAALGSTLASGNIQPY